MRVGVCERDGMRVSVSAGSVVCVSIKVCSSAFVSVSIGEVFVPTV